jgi:hypothetical protein
MQVTRNSTREYLRNVPLPIETQTYKPVPHLQFIEAVLEEADKKNFNLIREGYNIAKGGEVISGKLVFRGHEDGMDIQIGLVNSYDKSKSAVLALGAEVFICLNGMVVADHQMRRKHTTNVWQDLNNMIQAGVENLHDEYISSVRYRTRFSGMDLNKRVQAELLGRLFVEKEILTPTMANTVRAEITGSKLFPDDNVWSFYNHVTHALKQSHPSEYIDRHVEFHEFMDVNFS